MNSKGLFLIFFLFSSIFTSINAENYRDYKLEVKDFTSLKLNDHLNVEYYTSVDSAGYVFFSCSPEMAKQILFSNNKNSLNIQVEDDFEYAGELPTIRVYSTRLEKVENGSDSTIRIISNQNVKNFKARVIGNGTIIIDTIDTASADLGIMTGRGHIIVNDGVAFKVKYSNVGTGTIQAGGLKANQGKVIIGGTGSVDCNVSESLTIYGMGSGNVYYTGNPQKVNNRSMGVKAHPIKN